MIIKHHLLILLVSFALCVNGKPYGDDNNDLYSNDDYEDADDGAGESIGDGTSDEENVIMVLPKFMTRQQNLMVNEGGTIRLPCIVDKLQGFVVMWKKGDKIVTVGKQVVAEKTRYQLTQEDNGNSLVISLAEEDDAGQYTCEISSFKPRKLVHSVKIRVRPEIHPVPDNGVIVAKTGDTVTLACMVTKGSPAPEVTWRRKEGRKMPAGEDIIEGLSLTYKQVTRHSSGVYICSADNGFGEPTTAELKLDVQHRPEIDQEETFIHTREGDQTEVICVVHSSPRAEITWYKNGDQLDTTTNAISHIGNRHTLSVPITSQEAFGQYTCRAQNQYGESQKTTEVSGKAAPANMLSDPKGTEYNRFHLEWTAESFSPITKFKVEFKEVGEEKWKSDETTAIKLPHQENTFTGSYVIPRLVPAKVYYARVSSQNTYGYSSPSQVFKFATKGANPVQKKITGNSGLRTNTASIATLATTLLISSLCIIF